MKILWSDYRDTLENRNLEDEIALVRAILPQVQPVIHPYESEETLALDLEGAVGLMTAFLPLGDTLLSRCPQLRCISIMATGFDKVDIEAASRHGIAVFAAGEYCTNEVADHTLAMALALARRLKAHSRHIDREHRWQYRLAGSVPGLSGKVFAIFGLGRIGQAVAKRAQAFGLQVVAVDPHIPPEVAASLGVTLVSREEVCQRATLIANHMASTPENAAYFNRDFFQRLKQAPIFLNMGRAEAVEEDALVEALDSGLVSAAGLDVLTGMGLDLDRNPLVGRDNVILTPHAAFYSDDALKTLQQRACRSLALYLTGEVPQEGHWVNPEVFRQG